MRLTSTARTCIVLAVVWSLGKLGEGADPCANDDAFVQQSIHWTAFCAAVKDAVFDGLSCDDYGLACPLSCGLCHEVADDPECDAAEVLDNKLALASLLNELGACPEGGCEAVAVPPSNMAYTERFRDGHVVGGYTSLDSLDPCGMWGVTCDRCGAVVDLVLGYPTAFPLQGLSSALFELKRLAVVYLPSTDHAVPATTPWLDGDSWARLTNLTVLVLSGDVRGDIPKLASNTKLSILRISHAELFGDINDAVVPTLKAITLADIFQSAEQENSTVLLDSKWCDMAELREVWLPQKSLHGTLPQCLSDLNMLHEVKLTGNPDLTGPLDTLFHSPTTLKTMDVGGCGFTGTLPDSFAGHTKLQVLDMSYNQISGSLPDMSQFTSLTFLSMRANSLSGAQGTLTGAGLDANFADNDFTHLPGGWFTLNGVHTLDLSSNRLSRWPAAGVFPRGTLAEDGTLLKCRLSPIDQPFVWSSMRWVSIAHNPLNGSDVRSVLGSFSPLSSLKSLDVTGCGLVSDLPNEGSLLPVINSDCLSNTAEQSFVSLVVLSAADNAISGVNAAPPSSLQQVDFSKNSLSTIQEDWFHSPILAINLLDNPALRFAVIPPAPDGVCPANADGPVAYGRGFSTTLSHAPESSECTVFCTSSILLQADSVVNVSALCRCLPGWYGDGITCFEAEVDTWSDRGASQPTPCPANSSSANRTGLASEEECLCNAGFFSRITEMDELGLHHLKCQLCPANFIGSMQGAMSAEDGCSPCAEGAFAEAGAKECEPCPLGSVGVGGTGQGCRACEQGHFATAEGQTACSMCAVGQYQNMTGSTACDECAGGFATTWSFQAQWDGTFLQLEGAPSAEHCGCAPDHMFVRDICQECGVDELEGLKCPGGVGNEGVRIEPGYYADADAIPSVYRCWGDEMRCPGYKPLGSSCAPDRIGVMCLECDDGMIPESDGACEECDDSSGGLLHIVVIIIFGGILTLYITMERQTKGMAVTQGFSLLAASTMSLLISCSQQVEVISQMASGWPNPVDWAIESLQFITITVQLLQIGCMSGITSLDLFVGKLSMMIFFILIVLTIHVIVVTMMDSTFLERRAVLVSSIGAVLTLFYITVVSVILAPFKCQLHPNGKMSNRVYQDILCWEDPSHTVMVGVAFFALLFPVGYLGLVFWVVQQYPRRVRMASTEFLKSWSFLLIRFKASAYWFAAVMALKNMTLVLCSVIPNTFMAMSIAEICLLVSLTLSANQLPFRATPANYLDMLVTFGMVVLGNLGFHERSDENYGRTSMAISFTVCLLGGFVLMPVALLARYSVLKMCAVKRYSFFLCHHKAGAGAFARLLKTWLISTEAVKGDVFLDCDNLENLEDLFTHVKTEVQTLVALSSADLLLRPWCAGEIAVSHASRIPVTPVRLADYRELPAAVIDDYSEHVDITPLVEHGIAMDNLTAALMWYQKMPGLILKSKPSKFQLSTLQEQLVNLRRVGAPTSNVDLTSSPDADASEVSKLCLVVDFAVSEAIASTLVLEKYLTAVIMLDTSKAAWRPLVVHQTATEIFSEARAAIVVFSVGCLQSTQFLALCADASKKRLKSFPVLVQESFRVPTQNEIEDMPLDANLARYLISIFKKIAKLFNAQYASRSVLSLVAESICLNFDKSINFRGEAGSKQSPSGVTPLATQISETADATEKRPSQKSPGGSLKAASNASWKSPTEIDDDTLSNVDDASVLDDAKSDSTKLRSASHHVEQELFDGGPDYRSQVPFWWWETEC